MVWDCLGSVFGWAFSAAAVLVFVACLVGDLVAMDRPDTIFQAACQLWYPVALPCGSWPPRANLRSWDSAPQHFQPRAGAATG